MMQTLSIQRQQQEARLHMASVGPERAEEALTSLGLFFRAFVRLM
jgi:hypothetical protein